MATKYSFPFSNFLNTKVDSTRLTQEIQQSTIVTSLDYINTSNEICDIWFKTDLSPNDSTSLIEIVSQHSGEPILEVDTSPRMPDGRPIVRADTRPLNTSTYFTSSGDDSTSIGGGTNLLWDFSNDDDLYEGPDVPSGYKCKQILLSFNCPVFIKDGTIYFFDVPWGCYATMDIAVPPGNYYPNPAGTIPAFALGLTGTEMYAYSGSNIVSYLVYVNKHRMYQTCSVGDELNAEGASTKPVPVGWYIRAKIYTPDTDVTSKGFGTLELYRYFTVLRPGMTVENLSTYLVDSDM